MRFLRRLVVCGAFALLALAATDVPGSDQPYSNVPTGAERAGFLPTEPLPPRPGG